MNFKLDYKGFENDLSEINKEASGIRYTFKFDNGFGASVVKNKYSYGNQLDLWELAVLFNDNGEWHLSYLTEITDDVLGNLNDHEVRYYLNKIKNLKKEDSE